MVSAAAPRPSKRSAEPLGAGLLQSGAEVYSGPIAGEESSSLQGQVVGLYSAEH